jgi:hypothetical protein
MSLSERMLRRVGGGMQPIGPGVLLPPYEAFGELFMALHRPEAALETFETSVDHGPERHPSVFGAARAADRAGDTGGAERHYREPIELSKGGQAVERASTRSDGG